jgi:hypothetical protein
MYGQAIVGEGELETPDTSFWDTLGEASKNILQVGSQVYALQTQKDIEETRLQTAALTQPRPVMPNPLLQPTGVSMAPAPSGFPILPVVLGVGVLGVGLLLLTRKKGRR